MIKFENNHVAKYIREVGTTGAKGHRPLNILTGET